MNLLWNVVKETVAALPPRPLLVAAGAAAAAAAMYYYVKWDDGEKTTADQEDTATPEVFTEAGNIKLRVKVNKQTNVVEVEDPETTRTQLSTLVKEAIVISAGLSDSNVSTDQQNTRQSAVGLGTQQSGASRSHESPEITCDPEIKETDKERGEAGEEAVRLFIPEPMLCCKAEEGNVPHSLEMLYQTAQCNSASDCLLLAAHVLLLETGFLPEGRDVRDGEMPSGWRATGGFYRLQYSHPLCENSLVQVVAVPMGQTLVINATLKTTGAVELSLKLLLKLDAYVTEQWRGENAGVAYRDLQKLSRVFKDQLAYPLIAAAREALGPPALFGLAVLPPELLLRIMQLLDVPSILKMSEVCRCLHSATQDGLLWKHFVYRDFRVNFEADTEDWKELYKKKFQQKNTRRRYRARFHLFQDPPILHPLIPFASQLPGILSHPRYFLFGPFRGHEPHNERNLLRPNRSRAAATRRESSRYFYFQC